MHTKAKSRLTILLILLSFAVISIVSITAIFALTQQTTKTSVDIVYNAEDVVYTDGIFNVTNNVLSLVGEYTDDTLEIPSYIVDKNSGEQVPVYSINENSFKNNTNITSLTVSVNIPERAFWGCSNLTTIIIEGGVVVSSQAFAQCNNVSEIYLKGYPEKIGLYAFAKSPTTGRKVYIESLASYACMANNDEGATNLFYGDALLMDFYDPNVQITTIDISSSIDIAANAFRDLTSIEEVILDVPAVQDSAFYNCTGLQQLSFSQNVREIGEYAFGRTLNLTYVYFLYESSAIEVIEDRAFYYSGITEIMLTNVQSIGAYAFGNCSKLRYVEVGENINCNESSLNVYLTPDDGELNAEYLTGDYVQYTWSN